MLFKHNSFVISKNSIYSDTQGHSYLILLWYYLSHNIAIFTKNIYVIFLVKIKCENMSLFGLKALDNFLASDPFEDNILGM